MSRRERPSLYYDRTGKPITIAEWTALYTFENIVVEKTPLMFHDEPVEVSTVWLGIDHAFGDGPPIIFETMVFGGPHGGEQWRYSTEAQAREGHAQVVHDLGRERLDPTTAQPPGEGEVQRKDTQ